MPRPSRLLVLIVGTLSGLASVRSAFGEDAPEGWLAVRVTRPARLLDHEVVERTEQALLASPDFRDRTRTPEFQRLAGVRDLLETSLGIDWRTGLDRLARHVEVRSFDVRQPRRAVLIVQSDTRETLARFLASVTERVPPVRALADEAAVPSSPAPPTVHRLGEAYVAIDGPRLIVSPIEDLVRESIGRSLETKEADGPVLRAKIDATALRDLPAVRRGLALPADEPGAVAFLGGWMDRLGRGRTIDVSLDAAGSSLEFTARLSSDATAEGPRVAGAFAPVGETISAPLAPTGTIYSACWYTDYARLWDDRAKLVEAEPLAQMEKRDGEIGKELEVLGLRRPPSDVARTLGTQYHVVLTRGESPAYDVDLDERLPQAAFAVSLRDEAAFRETFEPVFRIFGLILAGEQKMLVTSKRRGDASITMVRYRDDHASQSTGNVLRYHFSPSWTIARGHFVIGTTTNSVEGVLDALANPVAAAPNTTASSVLSLVTLADAVDDAATLLVSRAQLDQGVSSERAKDELAAVRSVLRSLGRLRTRTAATEDTVEVTLEIGPE